MQMGSAHISLVKIICEQFQVVLLLLELQLHHMCRSLCIPNYSKLCLQVLHMNICSTQTHHGNFYLSCVSFQSWEPFIILCVFLLRFILICVAQISLLRISLCSFEPPNDRVRAMKNFLLHFVWFSKRKYIFTTGQHAAYNMLTCFDIGLV